MDIMQKLIDKVQPLQERLSLPTFAKLSSNIARVQFILGKKNKLLKEFVITPSFNEKCSEKAHLLHEEANALCKQKRYKAAIDKYNESVLFAESKSQIISCYANRSAAFYYAQEYENCLFDINEALENSPIHWRTMLIERKGKCLLYLKRFTEAEICFNELQSTKCSNQNVIDKLLLQCAENKGDETKEELDTISSLRELKSFVYKVKVQPVSTKSNEPVLQVHGEQIGSRCVKANATIGASDIVDIKEAWVSVLYPHLYLSHCFGCMRYTTRLVACRGCAAVAYCSAECEAESWNEYHAIECHYTSLLHPQWVGTLGHLALRLLMYNLKAKNMDLKQLVIHENERDVNSNLHLAMLSLHLLTILRNAQHIFENKNSDLDNKNGKETENGTESRNFEKDHSLASLINLISSENNESLTLQLLNSLMLIQCNGISIADIQNTNNFTLAKPVHIGIAMYPFLPFINHSCNPNLELGFQGSKAFLMACRDIAKGEEMCIDYGVNYISDPYEVRQKHLKENFLFACECEACKSLWPTIDNIESESPKLKCQKCSYSPLPMTENSHCLKCKSPINIRTIVTLLQRSHDQYATAMGSAKVSADYINGLPNVLKHLSLMQRLIQMPWREICSCQATVVQAFRVIEKF